jgi:hypothetical protein
MITEMMMIDSHMSTAAATVGASTSRLALLATAAAASSGATSSSYSVGRVSGAVIGPLPSPKTITITFVPHWTQYELKSMTLPISCCLVFGPANTLPQHAPWSFDFNLYATDQLSESSRKPGEEVINKPNRCLLWYNGKPFGNLSASFY